MTELDLRLFALRFLGEEESLIAGDAWEEAGLPVEGAQEIRDGGCVIWHDGELWRRAYAGLCSWDVRQTKVEHDKDLNTLSIFCAVELNLHVLGCPLFGGGRKVQANYRVNAREAWCTYFGAHSSLDEADGRLVATVCGGGFNMRLDYHTGMVHQIEVPPHSIAVLDRLFPMGIKLPIEDATRLATAVHEGLSVLFAKVQREVFDSVFPTSFEPQK